jgi:hypothetical protein
VFFHLSRKQLHFNLIFNFSVKNNNKKNTFCKKILTLFKKTIFIYVTLQDRPAATLKRANQHAAEAVINMVFCYDLYPSIFQGHRKLIWSIVLA